MTMILKNVMAPLKMGSFLILALLAIFAYLAIQIPQTTATAIQPTMARLPRNA
jgi:hypothetical protein